MRMSEEKEKEKIKNDDVVVSDKDIEDVTKEVLKKDEEDKKSQQETLEKEIRAKIAKEDQEKADKEERAALKQAIIRKEQEKEEAIKKLQAELDETKKKVGSSKAVINTQNPFQKSSDDNDNKDLNAKFAENLTSGQLEEIDDLSREKWEEYQRKNRNK